MKNKILLYEIGNEGNFNFYVFNKRKKVYSLLAKILYDVLKIPLEIYNGNNKKINVFKYKDFHQRISSIEHRSMADIFYGDKRIFLTINCSPTLRLKFNQELFKIVKMFKSQKIKIRKIRK